METWQHHPELGWWAIDIPALVWRRSMPTIWRASLDGVDVARVQEYRDRWTTYVVRDGIMEPRLDGFYPSMEDAQEAVADYLGDVLLGLLLARLHGVSREELERILDG